MVASPIVPLVSMHTTKLGDIAIETPEPSIRGSTGSGKSGRNCRKPRTRASQPLETSMNREFGLCPRLQAISGNSHLT
jgi:hypothetical protein